MRRFALTGGVLMLLGTLSCGRKDEPAPAPINMTPPANVTPSVPAPSESVQTTPPPQPVEQPAAAPENPAESNSTGKTSEHPCESIEKACTDAGFVMGNAPPGKGLYSDCVDPTMRGGSVSGLTIEASLVPACREEMVKRMPHH